MFTESITISTTFGIKPHTSFGQNSPAVLRGEELVDSVLFDRSEFFNDFLRPLNIQGFLGVVIHTDPMSVRSGMNTHFGFYRAVGAPPFAQDEIHLVKLLLPHLKQACAIRLQLAESRALRVASLESLELLPLGVILLGPAGTALFCNQAAEAILRKDDGLTLDAKGHCRAASPTENTELQTLIHEATLTGNGTDQHAGGAMKLSRKRSEQALAVLVSPLRSMEWGLPRRPCAVLFIGDPDQSQELPSDLLSRLYGLSPTEAQLVISLVAGTSLNEFAEARNVSINTVRTQFKNVLRKTGTRRQAELVRLILTSPVMLRRKISE